jgi:hypothetical protein
VTPASWSRAPQSGYRESDPDLHHGKVMRCRYAISAWSPPDPKSGRAAICALVTASPPPVPTRASCPYRGLPGAGRRAKCASAGELATSGIAGPACLPVGVRAHGAATRCRAGPPALRGPGRSRARRPSCRARTRTSIRGFRDRCPAIRRPGIEHRRRESKPAPGRGLSSPPLPLD